MERRSRDNCSECGYPITGSYSYEEIEKNEPKSSNKFKAKIRNRRLISSIYNYL